MADMFTGESLVEKKVAEAVEIRFNRVNTAFREIQTQLARVYDCMQALGKLNDEKTKTIENLEKRFKDLETEYYLLGK